RREFRDPALERRLRIIEEQAERMASAVRDLLERAKPSAESQPVHLGQVLVRIAEAMRVRLAAGRVRLNLQIGDPLPVIAADEGRLELALLNLVTNALDAMPDGGTLTLAAHSAANTVRIEIGDTGTGIPAAVLPKIFEPWIT